MTMTASVFTILGLPPATVLIVGGLFLLSALAPSLLALFLRRKGVWKDE